MINVIYRVKIYRANRSDILEIIQHYEYGIKETKEDTSSHSAINQDNDTTNLICHKKFHAEELDRALDLFQVLNGDDGVIQIAPMFISKKSKVHIIAIPISGVVTFGTILSVVHGIAPDMSISDSLYTSGLPAVVAAGAQFLYRILKWI